MPVWKKSEFPALSLSSGDVRIEGLRLGEYRKGEGGASAAEAWLHEYDRIVPAAPGGALRIESPSPSPEQCALAYYFEGGGVAMEPALLEPGASFARAPGDPGAYICEISALFADGASSYGWKIVVGE
jgi:hypothetical protein